MNLVVDILCPGYEDRNPYVQVPPRAGHYPDMWPEELHAEAALYLEHKKKYARRSYEVANGIYTPPQSPRQPEHGKESPTTRKDVIVIALLSIVREQGWHVRNDYAVSHLGVKPVYAIDPDVGGPAPIQFSMPAPKQRVKTSLFANRRELLEYALVTIAREDNWEENESWLRDPTQPKVYRIR